MKKKVQGRTAYRARPYERCFAYGAGVLTDEELLAVIFRTGTNGCDAVALAEMVLQSAGEETGLSGLNAMTVQELMQIPGIGRVKAVQVRAVCELARRMSLRSVKEGEIFDSAGKVADHYMETLRHRETEAVFLLMLDTRLRLIREEEISTGTVCSSAVSVRELFIRALRHKAVRIILVHNHPSGDPEPSGADQELTLQAYRAGMLIGITLADHIIIGDHRYYSFLEDRFFERAVI
ncbi:MAG: DNA repair protein RadC [Lachnospiraceae bacterium]|nr:DNA repair protein RadC [Lachnospiraceae bacterium]